MNEEKNTKKSIQALTKTVLTMGPAIGTAILATILGFVALYVSPVPMVADFGKMLTIGVIVSFLFGILILLPILFVRDRFFETRMKNKSHHNASKMERFLGRFAKTTLRLKWLILIVAIVITGWGFYVDQKVGVQTDVETFMPQNTKELNDIHKLRDILGSTDQVTILLEGKNILDSSDISQINRSTVDLPNKFPNAVVDTKSITSVIRQMNDGTIPSHEDFIKSVEEMPQDLQKMFVNKDRTETIILVSIKHLEAKKLDSFINDLKNYLNHQYQHTDMKVTVTGKSVLDAAMISALTTGRYKMTGLGMLLVFLGLLVIYRHPMKAFIPLLPISFIIGWSGAAMYLLGLKYTPLTATLGALIIGMGTEFTILLMERFYEQRRLGDGAQRAVVIALQKIGKAVIASGLTVVGGFSALMVSDFIILKDFGFMTVINMLLALLSTLLIMPPILVLFDRFVKIKERETHSGQFERGI